MSKCLSFIECLLLYDRIRKQGQKYKLLKTYSNHLMSNLCVMSPFHAE